MHKCTNFVVTCALLLLTSLAGADILPGKPTVLITGGNRGIGLEFVKQFTGRGWNVIAAARKPEQAEGLNALGPLKICQAFIDHVAAPDQKKLIVISSKAGSISANPKMPMF